MKEGESPFKTDCYEVGDLFINLADRTVYRDKDRIELPELSFDLFAKLINEAPESVNRDSLIQDVWRTKFVNDDTIVQRVALLRKALGDDPKVPRYIRTIRGGGYAVLARVTPKETHVFIEESKKTHSPADKLEQFKKVQYISVSVLIIIAVLITGWPYLFTTTNTSETENSIQTSDDKLNEQARQLLSVWQAEETNTAIGILQSLLNTNPEHTQAKLTLSFALSTRETKFEGLIEDAHSAEKLAREVIKGNSGLGRAWHALAYSLDAQSRIDEALLAYQRAYELDQDDITAMSSAANLLFVRGRLYDSLKLDLKGQKSLDSSIYSEIQIAKTLELLEIESSEYWWQEAEKLPLNDAKFRSERIQNFLNNNQLDEAQQLLSDSLDRYPDSKQINYLFARLMLQKNDTKQARQYYAAAGKLATNDLAALAAQEGQAEVAKNQIEEIQQAIFEGNTWPTLRITLAALFAASDQDTNALNALSDAIDLGWRDINAIENSYFLSNIITTESWDVLTQRIKQELKAQRELVSRDGIDYY